MPQDRSLKHLYPEFRAKVEGILEDLARYVSVHMRGYKWVVVEGFRSAERQHSLWEQGRSLPGRVVTMRDGYKRESNHQSSLAADIAPKHGHEIDWECKKEHWEYLGHAARERGLVWGGDWGRFADNPHVEWPQMDIATYKLAREWQKENGLR